MRHVDKESAIILQFLESGLMALLKLTIEYLSYLPFVMHFHRVLLETDFVNTSILSPAGTRR